LRSAHVDEIDPSFPKLTCPNMAPRVPPTLEFTKIPGQNYYDLRFRASQNTILAPLDCYQFYYTIRVPWTKKVENSGLN